MSRTFFAGLDELRARTDTDEGNLHGAVTVDQVYAHYQHEHLEFRHPRGGMAKYLEQPLLVNAYRYFGEIAKTFLEDGGKEGMKRAMEDLAEDGGVATHAPVEFDDLRRSGHPQVWVGERLVYDRQPRQHRLSREELRIKSRLRKLPPEIIGYIWWHVMHNQKPPPHLRGR
jgi:hypothetical protein